MRRFLLFLLAVYITISTAFAQEKRKGDAAVWMARFEQAYGVEGMYIIEVSPDDPGANSRLNLQEMNSAANRYMAQSGKDRVDLATLASLGVLKDLRPKAEGEEYIWDDMDKMFVSNLDALHNPEYGAVKLLRENVQIRRKFLSPDDSVRSRWKKLYGDPDAPLALKREIEAREFLLTNWDSPETRVAEATNESLSKLEEAIKMYAVVNQMEVGDPIDLQDLIESRMAGFVERPPDGVEVRLSEVGKPPVGIYKGFEITSDPATVLAMRRELAKPIFEKYGDYPPAIALRARLEEPKVAAALLDKAIDAWPHVPVLRVERMTQQARNQNYDRWTDDLDFLLTKFPAAPILMEIIVAAEVSGAAANPESKARFITTVADVRPDLLTPQLLALDALRKSGDYQTAKTIWDRLVFANPAWKLAIPEPEPTRSPKPEPAP